MYLLGDVQISGLAFRYDKAPSFILSNIDSTTAVFQSCCVQTELLVSLQYIEVDCQPIVSMNPTDYACHVSMRLSCLDNNVECGFVFY